MKTSELRRSRFLKKEDVDPPIDVTITAVKQDNVAMQDDAPDMRYVMFFKELEKGLVLNVDNGELLTDITGSDDSENWIGHQVQLWSDPSVKYGGKRVGGVRIRRVGGYPADATRDANREMSQRRSSAPLQEDPDEIPF